MNRSDIVPFVLRRDPIDWHTQLRRGLGRAVFYAQECYVPERDRETLTHSVLHRDVWDDQIEQGRGPYLAEVIRATGDADYYIALLRDILHDPDTKHHHSQAFDIACHLISRGFPELRGLLYESIVLDLRRNDTDQVDVLIQLDGLEAVRFLAAQLPTEAAALEHSLHAEKDTLTLGDSIAFALADYFSEETDWEAHAWATLIAEGGQVARVATLCQTMCDERRTRRAQMRIPDPVPSYDIIKECIETAIPGQYYRYTYWGRRAPQATVAQLAEDMLHETDPERVKRYLRLFHKRPFPGDPYHLVELTLHPDHPVSWRAVLALAQVKHPFVRNHALTLIGEGERVAGVELLENNGDSSDLALYAHLQETATDDKEYHHFGMALRHFLEAYPTPDALPVLLHQYENNPCSFCRSVIVQHLQEQGVLPEWIHAECAFDADEGTRKFANA